jgi:transcription termination factor Rho
MAESDEQPTLLGDETQKAKKPKGSRSVTASKTTKKPVAKKTGVKRTRKSAPAAEIPGDEVNGRMEAPAVAADETEPLRLTQPAQEPPVQPSENREAASRPAEGKTGGRVVRRTAAPLFEPAEPPRTEDVRVWSPERHTKASPPPAAAAAETEPVEPSTVKDREDSGVAVEAPRPEPVYGEGLIEVSGKGFGFLRDPKRNYMQSPQDIFVTPEVVRKHALRDGLWIKGEIRRGSRGPQLFKLVSINNEDPDKYRNLPVFEELTSINPIERIRLETVPDRYTTRVMDLMTPIGKGQRGLIVAPPRTGKTTLLQHIADAVCKNHPEMNLIILLVDERPEEVTEIRRTVPKADIMASSNDSDLKSHTRIAQLAIERAKRLVEAGKDVFVLMDSLTRIGRAFNNAISGSGRTMSGGMDSRAMEIPRKLFAAARNTEEAGSLTIMATALIETGSKMDELIFQEFKGTGNMEMVLDRQISDQRIYPAIDIFKSGTRREELLLPAHQLDKINMIRRGLAGHRPSEAIERLLSFLRKFPTNAQMLREIPG